MMPPLPILLWVMERSSESERTQLTFASDQSNEVVTSPRYIWRLTRDDRRPIIAAGCQQGTDVGVSGNENTLQPASRRQDSVRDLVIKCDSPEPIGVGEPAQGNVVNQLALFAHRHVHNGSDA